MASLETRTARLASRTRSQLEAVEFDRSEPKEVRQQARALKRKLARLRLKQAVARFEEASPKFTTLTAALMEIVDGSKGEAKVLLTPVLGEVGQVFSEITGDDQGDNQPALADGVDLEPDLETSFVSQPVDAATAAQPGVAEAVTPFVPEAPAAGTANRSKTFAEISTEYEAVFAAATIAADKMVFVDRACDRLLGFRDRYRQVEESIRVPWFFVGVIHSLESASNFGAHLHNGDSLTARTRRVPAGRPKAEDFGDPPFTWEQSAQDAMAYMGFNTKLDWSLPHLLYRLERYNGMGYRTRGLASPYLWSFSDRYIRGKFVADGKFDANHVSKQCGAAVILKRLQDRDEINLA